MQAISIPANEIMEKLTEGVDPDHPKKLQAEGFQDLCIEWIGENNYGPCYSVAQYYELNGDLMRDPDIEFIKGKDGNFYPYSYRQDNMGLFQDTLICIDGEVKGVEVKAQRAIAHFCNEWLKALKMQFKAVIK